MQIRGDRSAAIFVAIDGCPVRQPTSITLAHTHTHVSNDGDCARWIFKYLVNHPIGNAAETMVSKAILLAM